MGQLPAPSFDSSALSDHCEYLLRRSARLQDEAIRLTRHIFVLNSESAELIGKFDWRQPHEASSSAFHE